MLQSDKSCKASKAVAKACGCDECANRTNLVPAGQCVLGARVAQRRRDGRPRRRIQQADAPQLVQQQHRRLGARWRRGGRCDCESKEIQACVL